jgi:transcriptional regulator GlxA family with amidase domain
MQEPRTIQPDPHSVSHVLTTRLREPWSVPRMASALGLSRRTLHRIVRRESGVSPMVLLRRARMAEARARLESPVPGATVTRIALDCGFAHLGRFSQEYAAQFGESPSATLRRAWRGHVPATCHLPSTAHRGAGVEL